MTEWQRHMKAWGRPTDERALYTIIDYNLRTASKAWATCASFATGAGSVRHASIAGKRIAGAQ